MPGQPGMMPGQPGAPGQPAQELAYRPLDVQTIRAIVEALGQIGSRSAQQQLAALIAGKIKTDDDRAATEAALECLVAYPRPEYESMLFIVLTAPDKARPSEKPNPQQTAASPQQPGAEPGAAPQGMPGAPGSAPAGARMTADEIQRKALSLVETTASEALRLKLAQYLAEASTPEPHRALMGKFLLEERPENVAAQVVIYGSPMASTQIKTSLDAYFQRFSSYAVGRILGVPVEQMSVGPSGPGGAPFGQPSPGMAPGQPAMAPGEPAPGAAMPPGSSAPPGMSPPAGAPGMTVPMPGIPGAGSLPGSAKKDSAPSDPELPYHIAQLLWSPKFSQALQTRLEEAESLEKAAQDLAWATTIPTIPMRAAVYAALYKHKDKGAKSLWAAGVFDRVVSEPGFVVLVKSLPRKDVAAGRTGAGGADAGRAADSSRHSLAGRMERLKKASQERDQIEGEWMKASEDAVRAVCRRLSAAAKARAESGDAEPSKSAASLPVELPDGLTVAAEYHLTWPGALGKKLTDIPLAPTRLHYVRIETTARVSAVVGVFKRRISQPVIHTTELGPWLDSFRPVPKTDRKMSIDVLVTKTKDLAAKEGSRGISGPAPGPVPGAPPEARPGAPPGAVPGGVPGEKPSAKGAPSAEEPTELVVEILTLEMRDPAPQDDEQEKK